MRLGINPLSIAFIVYKQMHDRLLMASSNVLTFYLADLAFVADPVLG